MAYLTSIGAMLMLGLLGVILAGTYTRAVDEWLMLKQHTHLLDKLEYTDRLWLALKYEVHRVREQYANEQDSAALCLHEVDCFLRQAQDLQYNLRTASVSHGPAEGFMECLSAIAQVRRQKQLLLDYRADCLSLLQNMHTITNSPQQHAAMMIAMPKEEPGQSTQASQGLVIFCLERTPSPMRMAEIYLILAEVDSKVAHACRADQLRLARKKSFKDCRPDTEIMKKALQQTIGNLSPVQDFIKRL